MWFLKVKSPSDVSEKVFEYAYNLKSEANMVAKEIRLKPNMVGGQVMVCDGKTESINPDISEGTIIYINLDNNISRYGEVQKIMSYLIVLKKDNGDIVEFSKATFNIKFLNGVFMIKK